MTFVLWAILAATAANDDPERALANTHETRQQVSFALVAPDEAVFSVTRDFAARSPADPIGLERHFQLPDQTVVTSFAIQTDGSWRKGRLVPVPDDGGDEPRSSGGDPSRPWASLTGDSYRSFTLSTASFRTARAIQIRYTLRARGESVPGGRRWTYCGKSDPNGDQEAAAELSLPAGHPELRAHPDPDDGDCWVVDKAEPEGKTAAALFGAYHFAPGVWWWRLEVAVPKRLAEIPSPPASAPVVFVLDASRSQERRGGLAPQLAIVEAYLANVPGAEVELVTTSRTAAPVFGRFVPASAFKQALPADLLERPLGNGSFLDRGAALAAETLRQRGKPGRIILMTDGTLRSRFDRRVAIGALRRAPAGTIVHLLYPSASKTSPGITHLTPEGLGALPAAFGGASYVVSATLKDGVVRPLVPKTLGPLLRPDTLDSLSLVDASKPSRPDWPERKLARLGSVLAPCAVGLDPAGTIRVEIETDEQEILDVTVEGGDEPVRRCLEEGLWAARLPATFNEKHSPEMYRLTLAPRAAAP